MDNGAYKKGELAKEILRMIAAGIIIPASFAMPNLPIILAPLIKNQKNKRSIIKSIDFLKRNDFILVIEKEKKQILTISHKGKKKILEFNLDNIQIKKPRKWDGYWRIVIFDIPEKKKKAREALRGRLAAMNFFQMQKSCFIYPYECRDEIEFISNIFNIKKYIKVITAIKFDGEDDLKNNFKLV